MSENLYEILQFRFPENPDAPCLILPDGAEVSYGRLHEESARCAGMLASLGVRPGVSIRIADDENRPVGVGEIGQIQVKGENVFCGYWRMPEKTREEFTEDGFFKTGDMGKWDGDGYISIIGRSKDLIISGGLNVYSKEIEEMIDAMPGVFESAVVGVPHPDFGEALRLPSASGPEKRREAVLGERHAGSQNRNEKGIMK